MKRDLIGPPIDAPVLPEDLYYYIHASTYNGEVTWTVIIRRNRIVKQRYFLFKNDVEIFDELSYATCAEKRDKGVIVTPEEALTKACEDAYDRMVKYEARKAIIEKYSGDQKGQ